MSRVQKISVIFGVLLLMGLGILYTVHAISFVPPATLPLVLTVGGTTPPGIYTLTVSGKSGAISHAATFNLIVAGSPSCDFSAAPTVVAIPPSPGHTTLTWSCGSLSPAATCSIDHNVGGVTPVAGGSIKVSLSTSTLYTMTCNDTAPGIGSITTTSSVDVTVKNLGLCEVGTGTNCPPATL